RHRGDARLARQVDVALVGLDLAHHRGEQRGLAGAVAADHADPIARMEGQVDVGQQEALAAAEGEIAEGNHGGGARSGTRILPASRPVQPFRKASWPAAASTWMVSPLVNSPDRILV